MRHKAWFNDEWTAFDIPKMKPYPEELSVANITALGSCFARNVTRWLEHYELSHYSSAWDILYNVFSIEFELRRVFEKLSWEEFVIIEENRDSGIHTFRDPWRSWIAGNSLDEVRRKNDEFDKIALKGFKSADTFLITLGVSEIWEHHNNGAKAILNRAPIGTDPRDIGNKWQSRFATIEEVRSSIKSIINSINNYIGVDKKIVFTLSPVPIKQTSSGLSVREANTIVKSTLAVGIHDSIDINRGIYYFPSYEIVQALSESDRSIWQPDQRHLTAKLVDDVARLFLIQCGYHAKSIEEYNKPGYYVPFHEEDGRIVGHQYVDGSVEFKKHL